MFQNSQNQIQKNIWNTFEIIPLNTNNVRKTNEFKQLKIKKVLALENSPVISVKNDNTKKMFTNKKRGRRNLKSPEIEHENTHSKFTHDNLKRKVKTHFHNYIIDLLNSKLKFYHNEQKIVRFGKINSNITQNITVEYNRKLFKKQIKDIVIDVSDKYQNKNINSDCIKYIMENPIINSEVIKILNMTYEDLYLNCYLNSSIESESYERHKEKLRAKFGERYVKAFIQNAEDLINFYYNCKERKSRKSNQSNQSSSIVTETTQQNTTNIFPNLLVDNIKELNRNKKKEEKQIYFNKNSNDVETQTERSPYDEDSEN